MIGVTKQSQQLISIMRNQMIQLVMRAGANPRWRSDQARGDDEARRRLEIVDDLLMRIRHPASRTTNQIIDVWASNFAR
jgi:hypothetical protein